MSSLDPARLGDEFAGFNPALQDSEYSRKKIYGKLGGLDNITSVKDGLGPKTTTNVRQWMKLSINHNVGMRPDLWDSQSAFVRDAIAHRLHDTVEYEWADNKTRLLIQEGFSILAIEITIAKQAEYQQLYDTLQHSIMRENSPFGRQTLREKAAGYALDCPDMYWAERFRSLYNDYR